MHRLQRNITPQFAGESICQMPRNSGIITGRWSLQFSSGSQHNGPNLHSEANLREILGAEVESRTQGSRPRPRTQKIRGQGQGQPFRGQTLSRPRTGMLEAKAKDQGHSCKCSKKKRSSKKFFRQSPIYRRSQNF